MKNKKRLAWLKTVHHDGSNKFVSDPFPSLGASVAIRLRTGSDTPIKEVYLRTTPDGEQSFSPLNTMTNDLPSMWWECELAINQPDVNYRFLIVTEGGLWWYSAAGITAHIPLDATDFRLLADYHHPRWLDTAVFYQIFPDRFANGDPANDPQPSDFTYEGFGPSTYPWGTLPNPEQPFPLVFYGGDLPGIRQKLDYLDQLGVNALYLNPIFSAHSNHKYDVTDYEAVDPHFGGNDGLIQLGESLRRRNIRYILDVVPNHCGYWHPWFQKARNDAQAVECAFFTFAHHPDQYESWLGVWSLPKLDYRSQELRRRMYAGNDAIFKKWLESPFSADGWRVDVGNMLGRQGESQIGTEIVAGIRDSVKSTNPDAYLIGENFFDASSQLQGNQWDGVMNYTGFTLPLWYWLDSYKEWSHALGRYITSMSPLSTNALVETWASRRSAIPWTLAMQQLNLLGSHDTPRIKSIVGENEALLRLAAIVQFTYPGVPCLYYGDEVGLVNDPALQSRGCMVWDEDLWDEDLLDFYRKLIDLRKNSSALSRGGFQLLLVEEDSFAYQRESNEQRILVIANRGPSPRSDNPLPVAHAGIPDGRVFSEYFSGRETVVSHGKLPLPALEQGASLWIQQSPENRPLP